MSNSETGINPVELSNIAGTEKDHWWYVGMRSITSRIFSRYVSRRPFEKILEAGCGTGYNAAWLRNRYGWNIFPLDLESRALQYVRSLGLSNATQADIAYLPFQNASFDLVLSFDVLIHVGFGAEKACIAELFRVTKPGGMLCLRVAALEVLRSRHSQFIDEKQRFTRRRLIRTLRDCGYRVVHCTYANSLLLPVAVAKFRIWEPLTRQRPATGIEKVSDWMNTGLGIPLAIEAKWLGNGLRLPLGQSLIAVCEKPDAETTARNKNS